jgi:hypothetical protein
VSLSYYVEVCKQFGDGSAVVKFGKELILKARNSLIDMDKSDILVPS